MLFRKLLNFREIFVQTQPCEICTDIAAFIEIILNKYRYFGVWSDQENSKIFPFSNLENDTKFNLLVSSYIHSVVNEYERRLTSIRVKNSTNKIGEASIRLQIEADIVVEDRKFQASIILESRLRFKVSALI